MSQPAKASRRSTCFFLVLGALLIAPAGASAAPTPVEAAPYGATSASVSSFTANINDTAPRVIDVSYSGGAIRVSDSGGVTAVAPNCAQVSPTVASCTNPPGRVIDDLFVYASAGDDQITTTSLGPNFKTTYLDSNKGNDTITSGPTQDHIRADDGDDLIDGGLGADIQLGQAGIDTATYASRTEAVTVSVDALGTPDGAGGGAEGDNTDTENVIGGAGDDTITGGKTSGFEEDPEQDAGKTKSDQGNVFTGGDGNDTLKGGYDGDQLLGGAGNDRLSGERGADSLDGEAGKDKLSGGPQKDKLKGGPGKDRCSGGKANDRARQCENESSVP